MALSAGRLQMEFEAGYFQGEIREGFFVEEKMKRAWAAQMEVVNEVDKICKKHAWRGKAPGFHSMGR